MDRLLEFLLEPTHPTSVLLRSISSHLQMEKGQVLVLKDPEAPVDMEKMFTKPPPRYTEAS